MLSQNKDSCYIALDLLAGTVLEIIIERSNATNKSRPVMVTAERFNDITWIHQTTAPQPHQDSVQRQRAGEQMAAAD